VIQDGKIFTSSYKQLISIYIMLFLLILDHFYFFLTLKVLISKIDEL